MQCCNYFEIESVSYCELAKPGTPSEKENVGKLATHCMNNIVWLSISHFNISNLKSYSVSLSVYLSVMDKFHYLT